MSSILTDLSPPALAAAVRANLFAFFRCGEAAPVMEFARRSGFARWYLPHPLPLFHGALSSRDALPADAGDVDETLAYFRRKDAGAVCWWLADGVDPGAWTALLESRGFSPAEGPPGMAVDLAALPDGLTLAPGAEIHPVAGAAEMRVFIELLTSVFGFPPEDSWAVYEWELSVCVPPDSVCYIATLDGVPVGTSQVLYAGGAAGVYNVAVTEERRGMGLGAALTLTPLLEARERGYRVGVLQSSESGFPVYRRLGFAQVCRLDHHCLQLPA